jgi:hypothetical protein
VSTQTAWERWKQYRPEPADEWRLPRTRAEIVEELDLCGVPLDADPRRARAMLECNGVWAIPTAVTDALRVRRERVLSNADT